MKVFFLFVASLAMASAIPAKSMPATTLNLDVDNVDPNLALTQVMLSLQRPHPELATASQLLDNLLKRIQAESESEKKDLASLKIQIDEQKALKHSSVLNNDAEKIRLTSEYEKRKATRVSELEMLKTLRGMLSELKNKQSASTSDASEPAAPVEDEVEESGSESILPPEQHPGSEDPGANPNNGDATTTSLEAEEKSLQDENAKLEAEMKALQMQEAAIDTASLSLSDIELGINRRLLSQSSGDVLQNILLALSGPHPELLTIEKLLDQLEAKLLAEEKEDQEKLKRDTDLLGAQDDISVAEQEKLTARYQDAETLLAENETKRAGEIELIKKMQEMIQKIAAEP